MNGDRVVVMVGVLLGLLVGLAAGAAADVSPGDVVDKTNWQKVEGLVPNSVLNWVKKGDFVMPVTELNYDPGDYWPDAAIQSFETNKGKFRMSPEGLILEAATGKTPEHIVGVPFPEVDLSEPQAAPKLMYNRMCYSYCLGKGYYPMNAIWVGRGTGFEREVDAAFLWYPMVGDPDALEVDNSNRIEKSSIIQVIAPYDIAGTNILTWRYLDDRQDMTYGFVPAIRRVRRMSPANRSDAFIGTDMCVDDGYGFDGKISSVEWKPVRKQKALVPWLDKEPQPLVQNKKGEWLSTETIKDVVYGYKKEG